MGSVSEVAGERRGATRLVAAASTLPFGPSVTLTLLTSPLALSALSHRPPAHPSPGPVTTRQSTCPTTSCAPYLPSCPGGTGCACRRCAGPGRPQRARSTQPSRTSSPTWSFEELGAFLARRQPRALIGLRVSSVTPALRRVVAHAAQDVHTLGLRVDAVDVAGLDALAAALGGPRNLRTLELVVSPPLQRRRATRAPLPQREAGWALARLAGAAPGLTHLVLDVPNCGGWAAGPIVGSLPDLADLTLRWLPATPRLCAGARLSALTSIDLVRCALVALPTGSLAGVPLVRLRVWGCTPLPTHTASDVDNKEGRLAGWTDPAPSLEAALAAAEAAALGAGGRRRPDGTWTDLDDMADVDHLDEEDVFDGGEYEDSPWLNGILDVAHTLQCLEVVETPTPGGLFGTLAPALTCLTAMRVDTGFFSQTEISLLMSVVVESECMAHEEGGATAVDLAPMLGGAKQLTEVRVCGTGCAFSLAGAAAQALRVLDLRGSHNTTWPAGMSGATRLTELLLGFSQACWGGDPVHEPMEDLDEAHASFDLAAPPTLPALRRLVLINACLHLTGDARRLEDRPRPPAWARQLAAVHMPALTDCTIDDGAALVEPTTSGVRAVSFLPDAYAHAHGRTDVLRLTSSRKPFSLTCCLADDDDWHDETTDEEDEDDGRGGGSDSDGGGSGGGDGGSEGGGSGWYTDEDSVGGWYTEEDSDGSPSSSVRCCPNYVRRMARLRGVRRVQRLRVLAGAFHSWHGPGQACPTCVGTSANPHCEGGVRGRRAVHARLGVVKGRVE